MNSIITGVVVVALSAGAFYTGGQSALHAVKASCDNPDALTVLEKQEYVCMTTEDMKNTIKQVYIMGLNARNKQKEL
jgi:hypothetical protein